MKEVGSKRQEEGSKMTEVRLGTTDTGYVTRDMNNERPQTEQPIHIQPSREDESEKERVKRYWKQYADNPMFQRALNPGKRVEDVFPDSQPNPVLPKLSEYFPFTIDYLIFKGNDDFYDESTNFKDNTGQLVYKGIPEHAYVGVPVSLEKCLSWAQKNNGIVATMPYLIAGLSRAKPDNYLRKCFHTCYSEEFSGVDTEGVYKKGESIVIVQHGIEVLTPNRIRKAYTEGLTLQNGARLTPDEWKKVLTVSTPLYTVDDVKKGNVKNPFGRYRVVLSFDTAKTTISDHQPKNVFMNNDLVLARAGKLEYMESCFDNIQSGGTVSNRHRFREIDPRVPQGRVLFVKTFEIGFDGSNNLSNFSRFVGLSSKFQSTQKTSTGNGGKI